MSFFHIFSKCEIKGCWKGKNKPPGTATESIWGITKFESNGRNGKNGKNAFLNKQSVYKSIDIYTINDIDLWTVQNLKT